MNIRQGWRAVAASVVFLAAGCGGKAATPAAADVAPATGEDKVLNVYNWPDYVAEDTIANFEARTGIRVNYQLYSNNDALERSLASTPSAFDVVFPSARPYAQRHLAEGRYAALDKGRLRNWSHLDPAILAGLREVDAGNSALVPYMWGTTGLGVNVDLVEAILGKDVPLDSWALLFDPAIASQLSRCGIGVLDDDLEGFGAGAIWLGRDPNDLSADNIKAVRAAYAAIRPSVRKFSSTELTDDLAAGRLCLVVNYSGDVAQSRAQAEEAATQSKQAAPNIRYVLPKEGALRWTDVIAIPKQAMHPSNAQVFIDYLLEPAVIASISNYVAYANANKDATILLDDEIADDPGIYPPPAVQAKLVDPRTLPAADAQRRKSAWDGIVYGI